MASAKRQLPLQLQRMNAEHLQKVRDHVQGLLASGLQEIPDLNALDEILAANLGGGGGAGGGGEAGELAIGQRVQIQGLTGAVELNGKTGKIISLDESSGRYVVEVEPTGEQKKLKAANLVAHLDIGGDSKDGLGPWQKERQKEWPGSPKVQAARAEREKEKETRASLPPKEPPKAGDFTVGDRVRVGGLNGALDLNGQIAVVFGLDKATGRYLVEFENGQGQKRLQGKNLSGMGNATGAMAAKARMFAQMNGF